MKTVIQKFLLILFLSQSDLKCQSSDNVFNKYNVLRRYILHTLVSLIYILPYIKELIFPNIPKKYIIFSYPIICTILPEFSYAICKATYH